MKFFCVGFTFLINFAFAGVTTGKNIHWQGDKSIIGTAYGMDKTVDMAEEDALGAIFTGLKAAKNKPMVIYCVEGGDVLSDGTCPSKGPIVVALPITK